MTFGAEPTPRHHSTPVPEVIDPLVSGRESDRMGSGPLDCFRLLAVVAATMWIAGPACCDDLPPEVLVLARAGLQFKQDVAVLSSFACVETADRAESDRKTGKMHRLDRVDLEVTKIGPREWFSWLGGDSFHEDPAQMIGHGMIVTGEFLSMAQTALAQTHPIAFAEATESMGRKAYRYTYEVSPYAAKYHVKTLMGEGEVGIRGSVWIDTETLDVLAVRSDGWQMPSYLGLESLETTVSYQRLLVNQQRVLFPESAQSTMRYLNGYQVTNTTEFSHCRPYETSSRLVADLEAANAPPPEVRPLESLAANMQIELELETPIDSRMKVGTPIEGKLAERVRIKGSSLVIPHGARVLGRVRRLGPCQDSKDCWEVGIEFNEIDTVDRRFRFVARLQNYSQVEGLTSSLRDARNQETSLMGGGQRITTAVTTTTVIELPGTASFFLTSPPYRLPAGMLMTWVTTKMAGAK
jgi:hypothetical protein